MKTLAALAVALGLLVSTAPTTPARADGGAITLAIVAGVVTVASLKCAEKSGDVSSESLCLLSPFTYVAALTAAPRGNITVKARKKKNM